MAYVIRKYNADYFDVWEEFIEESMNGTFLQTRRFIEYHPEGKFKDHSLLIFKGDKVIAIILACEVIEDGKKVFFSHKGTTFGGIIVSSYVYNTNKISEIMELFEKYTVEEKFDKVYLKQTPAIFSRENTDLLDYFLYQKGYVQYSELNFYMCMERYSKDILAQFSASGRRKYRYSLRNELSFRELYECSEIAQFYDVLQINLKKLGLSCVHSLNELQDLKFNRFDRNIRFYGVFAGDIMIAGSMVFLFDNKVFHTQYLSSNEKYSKYYPMDFLIYNMIERAVEMKYTYVTLGIATEDRGRYLNYGLSRFKEGFGTDYCLNKSYEHVIK